MKTASLPPGDGPGLPFLSQTLTMLKNGFGFVEQGARRHGPIFQATVFGKPTAILTGPVFLIELYRSHDVSVAKPQNLDFDGSRIPPEPRDGLRATVQTRAS